MKKIITILTALFMAFTLITTSNVTDVDAEEMVSLYRVYNPNSGEHFYTSNLEERNDLVGVGWTAEGVGWYGYVESATSKTPVYRLYSGTDHHYTTSSKERDDLVKAGWKYEGIGWYSDDSKSVPLYRQYNPNVQPTAKTNNSGSHNYTTSKEENDYLVSIGWKGEGVAWYAMKAGYSYKYQPTIEGAKNCESSEWKAFTTMEYGTLDNARDAAFDYFQNSRIKCHCDPAMAGLYFNYNTGEYSYHSDNDFAELYNAGVMVCIGVGVYKRI